MVWKATKIFAISKNCWSIFLYTILKMTATQPVVGGIGSICSPVKTRLTMLTEDFNIGIIQTGPPSLQIYGGVFFYFLTFLFLKIYYLLFP